MPDKPLKVSELVPTSSITSEEKKRVWSEAIKACPDLWAKCYPRIYRDYKPNLYYPSKTVSEQLFACALKIDFGYVGESEQYEIMWASRMAGLRVPIYYVSQDILVAVQQTIPPIKLDWYSMELPFDAAAFMIPKGSIKHATEGNVQFVSYTRHKKKEWVPSLASNGPAQFASVNGGFNVFAKTDAELLTHFNMPYDAFPVADLQHLDNELTRFEEHEHSSDWPDQYKMSKHDTRMGTEITHLIFGLLLLMTRRPELVERATFDKRVKGKATEAPREFWNPAVIGRDYRIKRVSQDLGGTHASPRMHWVRGHWREQPYGPGRASIKDIWIEPFLKGTDE